MRHTLIQSASDLDARSVNYVNSYPKVLSLVGIKITFDLAKLVPNVAYLANLPR